MITEEVFVYDKLPQCECDGKQTLQMLTSLDKVDELTGSLQTGDNVC